MSNRTVHWFRQDLRTCDNPSLYQACAESDCVYPIYILDDHHSQDAKLGGASRLWLHESLQSLSSKLSNTLSFFEGDPLELLPDLCEQAGIDVVSWTRCYEPWQIKRDQILKKKLESKGVRVISTNGSLLWEPWTVLNELGEPYEVFSQFYRKGCLRLPAPRQPIGEPPSVSYQSLSGKAVSLEALSLEPSLPWGREVLGHWDVGEQAAMNRLGHFLSDAISTYKDQRNYPGRRGVSRLSPHLCRGEISPNQIWSAVQAEFKNRHSDHFQSELAWREFSYNQLYFHPEMVDQPLRPEFNAYPWLWGGDHLLAWQKGQTGVPLVDAGMRELYSTGYMHNRARLVVASYLVKNLSIHWLEGARWFWDCLFDADLANNTASWQWVAGCGYDSATYSRIFNPVTQAAKFDPDGDYIRQYVPEIADLETPHIYAPWETPGLLLLEKGITLGETYPYPLVDFKRSRDKAAEDFNRIRKN